MTQQQKIQYLENFDREVNKNKQKNILGDYFPIESIPVSLKSACQRHFGNFNNAKKAAGLIDVLL